MSLTKIKVLSIKQPHADDIVFGAKFCESRSWPVDKKTGLAKRPSVSPDEWLYIHASSWDGEKDETDGDGLCGAIIGRCKVFDVIQVDDLDALSCVPANADMVPTEALATLELSVTDDENREFVAKYRHVLDYLQREQISVSQFDAFAHGEVCWLLTDRQPIQPILNVKGKLNLWKYDIDESQIVTLPGVNAS